MLENARHILAKCEADLRVLLGQAAAAGDYDALVQITAWAKEIGALISSQPSTKPNRASVAPSLASQTKPKAKSKEYPRFQRRGDYVVKIGWSKRDRNEYEHKAPWSVAQPIARALSKLGAGGRVFQISELLPLTNPEQQVEVPDYQVYLMFAWLRTIGLIDKHGRQGYSVAKPTTLEAELDAAWKSLPTKK